MKNGNFYILFVAYLLQAVLFTTSTFYSFLLLWAVATLFHYSATTIWVKWFKTIRKMLPFFVGYLLFALLLKSDFLLSLQFLSRIIGLIFISSAFLNNCSLASFLRETSYFKKNQYLISFQRMIIGLSIFLPTLLQEFNTLRKDKDILNSLSDAVALQESKLHQYSAEIEKIRMYSVQKQNASQKTNFRYICWSLIALFITTFLHF